MVKQTEKGLEGGKDICQGRMQGKVCSMCGLPGVGPEWVGHESGRGLGNGPGEVPRKGRCA